MRHRSYLTVVKKKRRLAIPKDLNIIQSWDIIGPIVAKEIGVQDYTPIPYCFDTNAYKIGHIFVPTITQITCFRAVPVLKILGPIRDFIVKTQTNLHWLDKEFRSIKTAGDNTNFQVILENGNNQISFAGHNYYFLNKADDMLTTGNVTINRATHQDLFTTKWIGLITNVVMTKIFEVHIIKDVRARKLHIGDNVHTVLFKYEICMIDENGVIVNSETKKIHCKWLPIADKAPNSLPLTEFRSVVSKK